MTSQTTQLVSQSIRFHFVDSGVNKTKPTEGDDAQTQICDIFVRVVPPYSSQAIHARRGYKYFGPGHQSIQFRIHQSPTDYSSSLTLQVWTLQVCLGKKSRCLLIYLYIFEFMWKYNCLVNAQVFLCTIFWSYIVIGLLLLDIIRPSRKIWYWQKSPKHHPSQSWWHAYGECFPTWTFCHLLTISIIMTCPKRSLFYVCLTRNFLAKTACW